MTIKKLISVLVSLLIGIVVFPIFYNWDQPDVRTWWPFMVFFGCLLILAYTGLFFLIEKMRASSLQYAFLFNTFIGFLYILSSVLNKNLQKSVDWLAVNSGLLTLTFWQRAVTSDYFFVLIAVLALFVHSLVVTYKKLYSKEKETQEKNRIPKKFWYYFSFIAVVCGLLFYSSFLHVKKEPAIGGTPTYSANDHSYSPILQELPAHDAIDYNLFLKQTDTEKLNNFYPTIYYKNFGTVETGVYSGWKRIIGARDGGGPDGKAYSVFITKDNKQFLVDVGESGDTLDPNYTVFNLSKVTGTTTIANPFPEEIPLRGILLRRQDYSNSTQQIELEKAISAGKELYRTGDIVFKGIPSVDDTSRLSTGLVAQDTKTKVIYEYSTVSSSSYAQGVTDSKKWGQSWVSAEMTITQGVDYATTTATVHTLFPKYANYYQGGCGARGATLDSVKTGDLVQIDKLKTGENLYVFKDQQNSIVKDFYNYKLKREYDEYKQGHSWYLYSLESNTNDKVVPPSFEDYIKKTPVIVMKDVLGRYILLGEYYYGLAGGCGKPVIYLYPPKDTLVSLSFKKKVNFSVQIPTYGNGWKVLAHKDGTLSDISPEVTSCESINTERKGSEYAKDACVKNNYPYIYWSGNTEGNYPTQKEGIIVAKQDVATTLEQKLTELSLNKKERDDMLSYWVPELLQKNSPYYRISFIQTKEMNSFIPMQITPKPDSLIRVFLDWEPLENKREIKPQALMPTSRSGFTMVEWGGLKQ